MNLIFLSEHFDPITGGTTTYVKETCAAVGQLVNSLQLWVPSDLPAGERSIHNQGHYTVVKIGIGVDIQKNFLRSKRYLFCELVNEYLRSSQEELSGVHVLYGLFLAEKLDIAHLRFRGARVGLTVHNVPPLECGISWREDSFFHYRLDRLRLWGVRWYNRRRLVRSLFDYYVVPSNPVKQLLSKWIPENKIRVIGHGFSTSVREASLKRRSSSQEEKKILRILTVGGIVPHKNQHLIPQVGVLLRSWGIEYRWTIVGPSRNQRYDRFVRRQIEHFDQGDRIRVLGTVSQEELWENYQEADIYVQPSAEEGFCMTALDAALFCLPIVGTPVGAIPELIDRSGKGILTELHVPSIAESIRHWHSMNLSSAKERQDDNLRDDLIGLFSWEKSAGKLLKCLME